MNPRYPVVAHRATYRCEYCHAPQGIINSPFEVEHIQPKTKGGTNEEDNLALACRSCNIYKSDHLTGFDEVTQKDVRLFHPRRDAWEEHFDVVAETGMIRGLTEVGRATVVRLRMNREVQLKARLQWMRLGVFP